MGITTMPAASFDSGKGPRTIADQHPAPDNSAGAAPVVTSKKRVRATHTTSWAPNFHPGSTWATMIHDRACNRIFKISELTRLVASQLVLINPKSAVNLACARRYLEEPVLSTLWATQRSLGTLLQVLPGETWDAECPEDNLAVRNLDLPSEKSNA